MMVDVEQIRKSVNLLDLIGRDTTLKLMARTGGGEYAGPCPFCGGRDRLRVQPKRGLWWCRQCSGEHWQDAIAYMMKRDNVDFQAACKRLSMGDIEPVVVKPIELVPSLNHKPRPDDWQEAARMIVSDCETMLWSADGESVRTWLHQRGLRDDSLRAWRIGFCPREGMYHGLHVDRGITIPWFAGRDLWKINVRRPAGEPKYRAVKGSRQALYGVNMLAGKPDCLVVEGEFDAMLLWQEVGNLADVLTLGSTSGRLDERWLPVLLQVRRFWIVTDADEAGQDAAKYWLDLTGERGRRSMPPAGAKDVTEAWQKGADLRAWVCDLLNVARPAVLIPAIAEPGVAQGHVDVPKPSVKMVVGRTDISHWVVDPRPDLAEDSELWTRLLECAYDLDGNNPGGVFGALRAVRCCGARLVWRTQGLRIEPRFEPEGGWATEADWQADRDRLLAPHAAKIRKLLAVSDAVEAMANPRTREEG
jgi:hypothetical protein